MFEGFSERTFEFFMAIRFNNHPSFFHENHDWYVEAVRDPLKALAEALCPAIDNLDPALDTRPNHVVSRINRDIRFSADKSPYRDYMWLSFHQPGENRHSTLGAYFDISVDGASYGFGTYDENRPMMNGLRHCLKADEASFLNCWLPLKEDFALDGNRFKRMAIPSGLTAEGKSWYPLRDFYVFHEIRDFSLITSPALAEEIARGLNRLAPLYRYLQAIPPRDD